MDAFGITSSEEQEQINNKVIERIRHLEARARKVRGESGKRVMGREKLLRQPIDTTYRSKSRRGKRMWVLSEIRSKRITFINFLKMHREEARDVLERWKVQDYSIPFPLGPYPPSMPKVAEPIGVL